ncbi:hypothetical protein GCM10009623_22300 [Nocardioides aestuarii]|uniref:WD40 repeat domain-containing protein n=1 Tax=Nocardioides aestuarii TaxID=252231 RepID=A0ABW4TPA0_9ACTN
MSLETDLVDALDRAAAAHRPGAPDLDRLRSGGRRRARRRTTLRSVGVAAGLAVVAVLLPQLRAGGPSTAPEPAAPPLGELPVGEPPGIPHCDGGRTIVSGATRVSAWCDVLVSRGGSTLYLGDRRGVVLLRDEGVPVLLDRSGPEHWFPAVSNDGDWAAWLTSAQPEPTLVVVDLLRATVVAEVPWDSANGWVPGIDDLGRVYTVDFDTSEIRLYDIATDRVRIVTGAPDHAATGVRFVTADGLGILQGNPVGPVVVGQVAADGRFSAGEETSWDWVNWSPDRSRVVRDTETGPVISPAGGGRDVPLMVPELGSITWVPVWEDDDHVLVQYDPLTPNDPGLVSDTNGLEVPAGRTWLLRCSADTGECEIALEPGWAGNFGFPTYR